MISYYDIPYIVADKGGIEDESEFNALIEKECGADENRQYEFMCNWIRKWLKNNPLRFVLAEIWDRDEMAEFMCFVARYIDAFDYDLQDMISEHAYQVGGNKVEAAEQLILQANHGHLDPSKISVDDVEEEEKLDHEAILNEALQGLTNNQLLELITTVFGNDEYDEESLPEVEDCIDYFELLLDENGWGNDVLMSIVSEIQNYKEAN